MGSPAAPQDREHSRVGEPPFGVQVERGSVLAWGSLAQPWGWAVPWLEAGEGHRWAVDCWKGSTTCVCPRSTQPSIQGLQADARVLMAWGLHGLGEEPWVRTSAPSPASLCCPSVPCCCVSLSRGHEHHYSSGVINSSKHSRCLQAKSIWGEIPAIGSIFPSGRLISLSQLCSQCVQEPLDKRWC